MKTTISYFIIILLNLTLIGCINNFSSQKIEPPVHENLYLTVGQTTMSDVTKILNPDSVINNGPGVMMRTSLYHQNAILPIHINDNGTTYTKTLDLASLRGYFNHTITLVFVNGVLFRYHIG